MSDVEMKSANPKAEEQVKPEGEKPGDKKEEKNAPLTPPSVAAEIKANISFIERGVTTLEPRFTHRVLRTLTALRKRLNGEVLRDAISEIYPPGQLRFVV